MQTDLISKERNRRDNTDCMSISIQEETKQSKTYEFDINNIRYIYNLRI